MAGRIEVYVHSDQVTSNKGMGAIEVCSQTDFAARTNEFVEFSKFAARLCYAASRSGAEVWAQVVEFYPDLETARLNLQEKLGEDIRIRQIKSMQLADEKLLHAERNGFKSMS